MIKNDFRYIIKKILIGIGIIVGLSFIKSCNVYALEDTSNMVKINSINYMYRFDIWYDNSTHSLYGRKKVNGTIKEQTLVVPEGFDYYTAFSDETPQSNLQMFFSNSPLYASTNTGSYVAYCVNTPCGMYSYGLDTQGSSNKVFTSQYLTPVNISSNYNRFPYIFVNYDFKDKNGNLIQSKNVEIGSVAPPEIVSLNSVLNKTEDNMLVSVSFSPEFSYVDTENYNYNAWFDGYDKVLITENNTTFNTQNNTTFFVEITDKDNNYITSQTYTVSSIGLVYGGDYDIQFTTNEYSQSDIDNNTDNVFNTIDRISIDILYIPKWVNYKYQYQYVPENGSLTDNWIQINDNTDNNNVVYSATSNGTMYARILDSENNYVYSETYTITRIGQLKVYDKNTDKLYGVYNRIKDKLNFGGPISDLIVIPVNVLQSIANASNKVCTPYDFGSIAGHRIILPCIEPERYLGSAVWTTIDLIFSGCMFYAISKWFTSAYYKFILLDNTPGIKGRRDLD